MQTKISLDPKLAINELQKYYLCEWISAIYHYEFDEKKIPLTSTIDAFQTMLANHVADYKIERLRSEGLWSSVEKVRAIFRSSCPQVELDLIKFNNLSSPSITKEAVACHLRELIVEKITLFSRQLGPSEEEIQKMIPQFPPQRSGLLIKGTEFKFFEPAPSSDRNNPTIDKLNMSVRAFNEKFQGELSITESTGFAQGFWSVKNSKGELCGVLVNSGAAGELLKENDLSVKKHNFIGSMLQKSFGPPM